MTDEEKNIKVAKALGYKVVPSDLQNGLDIVKDGKSWALPRYTSDLEACHDMEGARTHGELLRMEKVTKENGQCCPYHASARQRVEAFLKTIK